MILRSLLSFIPLQHINILSLPSPLPVPAHTALNPPFCLIISRLPTSFFGSVCTYASAAADTEYSASRTAVQKTEGSSRNETSRMEVEAEKETQEGVDAPPQEPLPEACCGNGCRNCVWDLYFDALERYNAKKESVERKDPKILP